MRKPTILVVDVDDDSRSLVAGQLEDRYGRDYAVVAAATPERALDTLRRLAASGNEVALVLADQWMPEEEGAGVLPAAHDLHPHAKRGLLLAWAENRSHREAVVHALGRGQADHYLVRPVATPDERFHRGVTEFLDEWWRLRGVPFESVQVIGEPHSARSHEISDFLQRHDAPFGFHPIGSEAARVALERAGLPGDRLPVVVTWDGRAYVAPTIVELAAALGARVRPQADQYDVLIVGGGPAGLAAAVYAGSEGLRTGLIEHVAMGGQAGTSSMIRNYLGFPRGISGAELASRAFDQAVLFGTQMIYGTEAVSLREEGDLRVVGLADGTGVRGRTVVIATGVAYRMLGIPELEALRGAGVFYGAGTSEARGLTGAQAFVVGGGNSAGQAALHLAGFAAHVTVLVRSGSLAESMSSYLVDDIDAAPNIDVRYRTEVVGGGGDGHLQWLRLLDRTSGREDTVPAAGLFVLIGAEPFTDWLPAAVRRDRWGYVLTGAACGDEGRAPLLLETSMPGVFAVGDVRHGSVKRVASSAGEGAICVRLVHEHLAALGERAGAAPTGA